MIRSLFVVLSLFLATLTCPEHCPADDAPAVKETVVAGPDGLAFKVRMEGPYTANVPLQVVCYFKYSADGAAKMKGAPVELDKHLGGVIASLRERGEFVGDSLETVVIECPSGTIKAKRLLLIGLGEEKDLSLELMEKVGRTALRQAAAVGVSKVAFAPLIRDQGNNALPVADVATAVNRGLLLAYDTERRMQKEGLANPFTLSEWWVEAGPSYFDETVNAVNKAVAQAADEAAKRPATNYRAGAK